MAVWLAAVLGLVPLAQDLSRDGARAAREAQPILLYVTHSTCTFCKRFENDVLGPLVNSGELERVIVRELVLDQATPIVDFGGQLRSPRAVAGDFEAEVTPTLLIVDGTGQLLQPRMVGYRQNDFYSFYLERALKQARAMLLERQ